MQKSIIILGMILLFSTTSKAQSDKYDAYKEQWKIVKQFESKGLPKSALAEVEKIYKKSKRTKNSPQLIKTLLYKSKYALTLEEDAQLNIINEIKSEIADAKFPSKNILESILADLYWQYFQQNRWKFYNRTSTSEKVDLTDFRTWDLQTIFEETHLHYQRSLENALQTQQADLSQFKDILHLQKDSKIYRPTVYDFLAHRAIDFYKNDERNLKRPSYKFEIDNPQLLSTNAELVKTELNTKDSLSQQLHALYIYRNLTLFHLKDKNPTALVVLTLDRLDFARNNAVFNDKDDVYLKTLQELKATYLNDKIVTEIDYKIALLLNEQANSYVPLEKEDNHWKRKEALQICEEAIKKFPVSTGTEKCKSLQSQILNKSLQLTSEKFVPINSPSRILVNYKNTDQLYFKALKITKKQQRKLSQIYNDSAKIAFINKLKTIKIWEAKLINEKDYQQHKTEVSIPTLTQGNYMIFASTIKDATSENTYGYSFIQVTDLTLIENKNSGSYNYQVVNRNTGNPIAGATVHIKNYDTGRYNKLINKTLTTNSKGQVSFSAKQRHSNVVVTVSHEKDKAVFGNFYLNKLYRNHNNKNYSSTNTYLFTDRSIYRPGQVVYFKGIVVNSKNNKANSVENKKVSITLKDVNYQNIKTLDFTTNEFGSFSGEFILPSSGLTGQFTIETHNGSHYFSVEEYKRPKFEAEFKPVTETYKLNDSITVKGTATAYAGSMITDAKVSYRVVRTAQYPKWYWYYRPSISSDELEITHGESVTDASGNFEITFEAIPDLSIKKETQPTFNYKVFADITDINGETRSTETTVRIGYHALEATVSVADKLDKAIKDHKLDISTNNLNGEFVATKGNIKIYKLKAPSNVLRKRPWTAPDYQEFSKDEFKKLFPNEAYKSENDANNWEKGALVFESDFDTGKSKEIKLGNIKKWTSGKYIVVLACKDKFKQDVKDEQHFNVFSDKDKTIADSQLFSIKTDKNEYQPNEFVKLNIGSASKDITVTVTVEKNHTIIDTQIIRLSNNIKTISIPVNQKDVGGFAIHYQWVNYNSFGSGTQNISVPYPNHELSIETTTFRDKLQPGQDETWSFKLKGTKGDEIAAELLASMYDASLDQFKPHQWDFNPIYQQYYYSNNRSNAGHSFGNANFNIHQKRQHYYSFSNQHYDQLNWFGLSFGYGGRLYRAKNLAQPMAIEGVANESSALEEVVVTAQGVKRENKALGYAADSVESDSEGLVQDKKDTAENPQLIDGSLKSIAARKNLQETAFFFPHLKTDKEGNVSFNFTAPESLTRWKLQLLAHTKDMAATTKQLTAVTQKELMVLPNPPRFLRQGDKITIASKIANLTDNSLSGIAQLVLYDAITNKEITNKLLSIKSGSSPLGKMSEGQKGKVSFTVNAKGNTNVSWTLQIPDDVQAVKYKILAKAGDFTDGEENALPVLSNRMLVTETLPMWLRSNQTKTFTLDKLKNNTSTTLKNHKLTLEVTSNPAWYAVQALPYLMEYPYECSEQTFSRYYANALASHIANSNPRIQEVFNQWKNSDVLLSSLEKNQELKSMIIQETPWLRDAQSETEQKKRIALLFDLNKMKNELESAVRKLQQMQMSNGGFPWFKGAHYPSRYITQHIASGFGHIQKLGVPLSAVETSMVNKAVHFLDDEILDDYNDLLKQAKKIREKEKNKAVGIKKEKEFLARNHTSHFQVQYLYMRSFYQKNGVTSSAVEMSKKVQKAVDYYTNQTYKFWLDRNLYAKGMIALIAKRNNNTAFADKVITSLKENSITSDELGMYWKSNTASWYWYQAPIETQALLIEAFTEVEGDTETIDNLKIWLLKNKQTNRWKTTKATTEAVYALLLQGTDWLEVTDFVDITVGNQKIDPLQLEDSKVEAGTGYFKTSWTGTEITPEMATVKLSKKSDGIAWGALYWQYFEDLDKITSAETPLKLKKKLFLKTNTDKGEKLSVISDKAQLKLGDLVKVRIELRVDRTMEFVHMKDMRAAGFEPINVLSRYKYQDGLGYYESTKDAATNFFFDHLPKGVYVFEYDLRVNNKGDFSNGITTIQSMYAPEFSSHSEGIRVLVN
ncbi:MAG: MG2 domain-containing protein [Flavobacteriaceae bacterium]|nr:MG2 domain-containing protein [Flavobacteriaceae bacterium]